MIQKFTGTCFNSEVDKKDQRFLFFFLQISDTGQRCPVDNEMLSEDQLFPDNFAKREILSLTVRCPNLGCADKMELRHLEVKKTVTDMFDPNTAQHRTRSQGC